MASLGTLRSSSVSLNKSVVLGEAGLHVYKKMELFHAFVSVVRGLVFKSHAFVFCSLFIDLVSCDLAPCPWFYYWFCKCLQIFCTDDHAIHCLFLINRMPFTCVLAVVPRLGVPWVGAGWGWGVHTVLERRGQCSLSHHGLGVC